MNLRTLTEFILILGLGQAACCLSISGTGKEAASKVGSHLKSMTNNLGNLLKDRVQPATETIQLMRRYHNWMMDFKSFKAELAEERVDFTLNITDILKEEYTKADEDILISRMSAEDDDEQEEEDAKKDGYSIYEILQLAIERLEIRLAEMRQAHDKGRLAELVASRKPISENRINGSLARAKGAAINSSTELIKSELLILARLGFFNALAAYIKDKPDVGDPLDQLRPIILMMGSASTPLLISYLSSVESRLFMNFIRTPNIQTVWNMIGQLDFTKGKSATENDDFTSSDYDSSETEKLE